MRSDEVKVNKGCPTDDLNEMSVKPPAVFTVNTRKSCFSHLRVRPSERRGAENSLGVGEKRET